MQSDPYLEPIEPGAGSPDVEAVFADIRSTRGDELEDTLQVNELWQSYAHAPQLLATFWPHMRAVYREGSLSHELISKISLITASVLDCEKCRYFHTTLLHERGVDTTEIEQLRKAEVEDGLFSPRETVILRFAEALAADHHAVDSGHIERLREAELSDREIVELVDAVAIHVHTAVFQSALGLVEGGPTPDGLLEETAAE